MSESTRTELLTIVARPGSGKTTLLQRLLSLRPHDGILVDIAGELRPHPESVLRRLNPPLSTDGAREIARAARALRPGEWIIVDDAESFVHPWLGKTNPFRLLVQYRRNEAISQNMILAVKDPLLLPREIRTATTLWAVNPEGDPEIVAWLRRASIPTEPLPDLSFWAGRKTGPWKRIDADSVDFEALSGV